MTPLTRRGFPCASSLLLAAGAVPFAFAHPSPLHTADDLARMHDAFADSAAAYQKSLMWCVTGDHAHTQGGTGQGEVPGQRP